KTLSQRHTWVIIQDRKGDLWVGTEGGGVSVLRETGPRELSLIRHFKHDPQAAHTLSDNRVYALYEDRDGMIWVGTGNGLDRYDPSTQSFTHFSTSPNGLANGTIAGIVEDNSGVIWVSHKRGLSQIDRNT